MNIPLPPGTRLPDRAVWLNGTLVRGADAMLSVFDRGARDGGAILETLRCYDGEPFAWQSHLERLVLSAAELGFPVPPGPSALRDAVDQVLAAEGLRDAVVRITVTRGVAGGRPVRTGAWVEAESLGSRLWAGTRQRAADGGPLGARVILSRVPFVPGRLGRHKTTSRLAYDLAREEARAAGVDEALLVAPTGELLEGAASNLFMVRPGGELVTPPLTADVLPGVTRAIVLRLAAARGWVVEEQAIPWEAARGADELFLTNSIQEILPVRELSGHALPSSERTRTLLADYRALVAQR